MNEFQGTWKRRGLVHVPVIPDEPPNKGGRPRKVTEGAVGRMVDLIDWTPETLRAAHAAYERGNRDIYVLAGNREWNRLRMKADRKRKADRVKAGGLSATDLAWCEKQAETWQRLMFERTNRGSVAHI